MKDEIRARGTVRKETTAAVGLATKHTQRPYCPLGAEPRIGLCAICGHSREELTPATGRGACTDTPKCTSWKTHSQSWNKITEKFLLRVCC